MPQTTITLLDQTNLTKITKEVERAMKRGVEKATDSGATWVKEAIFNGQKFVGDTHYPNVKKATQRAKAKKGREKVGIMTGNLRDSFNTHYSSDGMTGTIRGGGEGMTGTIRDGGKGYDRFLARWQIDKLFYEHRAEKSKEIIDKEIKKAL